MKTTFCHTKHPLTHSIPLIYFNYYTGMTVKHVCIENNIVVTKSQHRTLQLIMEGQQFENHHFGKVNYAEYSYSTKLIRYLITLKIVGV